MLLWMTPWLNRKQKQIKRQQAKQKASGPDSVKDWEPTTGVSNMEAIGNTSQSILIEEAWGRGKNLSEVA